MGPALEHLLIKNFRNHGSFEILDIQSNLVFIGQNGLGKTNLLEAVQLAGTLESFRSAPWPDLIKAPTVSEPPAAEPWARVEAGFWLAGALVQTRLEITGQGAAFYLNEKKKRRQDMEYKIPMVSFVPDDLQLLKGPAEGRRRYLDDLGKRLSASYRRLWRDYTKIVRQRNAFLKNLKGCCLVPSLSEEAWNDRLADLGAALMVSRTRLFERLLAEAKGYYESLSGTEGLDGRYFPSFLRGGQADLESLKSQAPSVLAEASTGAPAGIPAEASTGALAGADTDTPSSAPLASSSTGGRPSVADQKEEYKQQLLAALERRRHEEYLRGSTLVGPHRDELDFLANGQDTRRFSSQGQQRTIILALKFGETRMLSQTYGAEPILLLDDVLSELDGTRRERLLELCAGSAQTIITATDIAGLPASAIAESRVIELF